MNATTVQNVIDALRKEAAWCGSTDDEDVQGHMLIASEYDRGFQDGRKLGLGSREKWLGDVCDLLESPEQPLVSALRGANYERMGVLRSHLKNVTPSLDDSDDVSATDYGLVRRK